MNWLILIIASLLALVIYQGFKHHFFRKTVRVVVTVIVLGMIVVLMFSFFDSDEMFNKEIGFLETGNAIVDNIKDKIDDIDIEGRMVYKLDEGISYLLIGSP